MAFQGTVGFGQSELGSNRVRFPPAALPFSPLDIPDCKIWLRADLGLTLTSGNVSTWVNQGTIGSAGDATQGSAGLRPIPHASGGALNSHPYLEFDGGRAMAWAYNVNNTARTALVVARISTLSGVGQTVYYIYDGVSAHSELILDLNTYKKTSVIDHWTSGGTMFGHDDTLGTSGHILYHEYDGSGQTTGDYAFNFDGTDKTSSASGAYGAPGMGSAIGFRPNATFILVGEIYEVLMWERVLTGGEKADLLAYAQDRYGL